MDTGEMSDFKIVVEEQPSGRIHEIKVHKLVLLAYDYFKAAITCNMKEKTENKMIIKDFSFNVVTAILQFMYTSRVKPEFWVFAEDLLKASDMVRHLNPTHFSHEIFVKFFSFPFI